MCHTRQGETRRDGREKEQQMAFDQLPALCRYHRRIRTIMPFWKQVGLPTTLVLWLEFQLVQGARFYAHDITENQILHAAAILASMSSCPQSWHAVVGKPSGPMLCRWKTIMFGFCNKIGVVHGAQRYL